MNSEVLLQLERLRSQLMRRVVRLHGRTPLSIMHFLTASVLVVIGVTVLGCEGRQERGQTVVSGARTEQPVDSQVPDSSTQPEYLTSWGCSFEHSYLHPDPTALVVEFLARDAAGEFLQTNEWFRQATTCPGHEPGPDAFVTVSEYQMRTLYIADSIAQFEVSEWALGLVIPGIDQNPFRPMERLIVDTLTALLTPSGWRIESPALRQHVVADTVLAKPWLPQEERLELEEALNRRRG